VIASLAKIHAEVGTICAAAAHALGRMAPYEPRLAAAFARVESGEYDGFAKPLTNSYHDIWMELHQDLMISLKLTPTAADA